MPAVPTMASQITSISQHCVIPTAPSSCSLPAFKEFHPVSVELSIWPNTPGNSYTGLLLCAPSSLTPCSLHSSSLRGPELYSVCLLPSIATGPGLHYPMAQLEGNPSKKTRARVKLISWESLPPGPQRHALSHPIPKRKWFHSCLQWEDTSAIHHWSMVQTRSSSITCNIMKISFL